MNDIVLVVENESPSVVIVVPEQGPPGDITPELLALQQSVEENTGLAESAAQQSIAAKNVSVDAANAAGSSASDAQNDAGVASLAAMSAGESAEAAETARIAAEAAMATKVDKEEVEVFSEISASTTPRLVLVTADETNDGQRTLYYHDGAQLNWIPMVEA